MRYGWHEVDRLTAILEAEYSGHPVDSDEARGLARRIAEIYPDVGRSMGLVVERMARAGAGR